QRWIKSWGKAEIFVKVFNPTDYAELPVGRYGYVWGQFEVHRDDREAAQQLVDSILRSPLLARPTPRPAPVSQGSGPGGPVAEIGRAPGGLVAPAVGLLLTAIAAVVSTVWLAAVLAEQFDPAGDVLAKCLVGAAAFVVMPAGVTLMAVGAVRMMRGRS